MPADNPKALKHLITLQTLKKYLEPYSISHQKIKNYESELLSLELKDRVKFIANLIKIHSPTKYAETLVSLLDNIENQKISQFELWPATEFIQTFGLDHVEESLKAMTTLTQKFTSEFAIRPFLIQNPISIYSYLLSITEHPNEHIRRWTSEGTRPRLPWGMKLQYAIDNPHAGLEILEKLKYDSSIYVQKSVANHLNDISKDHPDLVVKTLIRWKKMAPADYEKSFQFVSQRALRTLIKDGNASALKFCGVKSDTVKIKNFKIKNSQIKIGEKLDFSFQILNSQSQKTKFILDYEIGFLRANQAHSIKVFKFKNGWINANETQHHLGRQSFKEVTTRKLYPGEHFIRIKINGVLSKKIKFTVHAL